MKQLWHAWKRIAIKIGAVNSRVLLTLFYFVLVVPVGVIVRLVSDPLFLKQGKRLSYWVSREEKNVTLDESRRQF